jgi:hypothetical protein
VKVFVSFIGNKTFCFIDQGRLGLLYHGSHTNIINVLNKTNDQTLAKKRSITTTI